MWGYLDGVRPRRCTTDRIGRFSVSMVDREVGLSLFVGFFSRVIVNSSMCKVVSNGVLCCSYFGYSMSGVRPRDLGRISYVGFVSMDKK